MSSRIDGTTQALQGRAKAIAVGARYATAGVHVNTDDIAGSRRQRTARHRAHAPGDSSASSLLQETSSVGGRHICILLAGEGKARPAHFRVNVYHVIPAPAS